MYLKASAWFMRPFGEVVLSPQEFIHTSKKYQDIVCPHSLKTVGATRS